MRNMLLIVLFIWSICLAYTG